ncbi:hypothetical protein BU25DRAFT_206252 [Macroventuria anomochaeta]|uniref:Uncharacterized protein n=1 Tax=Macroventuria anomochaeta TaxID=301207 RepID=A0ACB6RKT4_9PLEO|nr:uncharacterized protein BU25DRAFT_206252 [Macroventuria anomochaeta]KAF2622565.1 hypothetical protein BU25DRAFT_206252 [Macroventuria anomochaeta]
MRCSRTGTVANALLEVKHLQDLWYHHIVRLVGTYLRGCDFALLMYPVADYRLGQFLQDTVDLPSWNRYPRVAFLVGSMSCIASAIRYVHDHTRKHMDTKPQNILVQIEIVVSFDRYRWKVYIRNHMSTLVKTNN